MSHRSNRKKKAKRSRKASQYDFVEGVRDSMREIQRGWEDSRRK